MAGDAEHYLSCLPQDPPNLGGFIVLRAVLVGFEVIIPCHQRAIERDMGKDDRRHIGRG